METLTGFEDEEDYFFNGYEQALADQAAALALSTAELEPAVPALTSDQLERAGRFRKPVAAVLGVLSAMTLLGLAQQQHQSPLLSAARVTAPAARAVAPAPASPRTGVTASLAPALPQPEPEIPRPGPSLKLDPATSSVSQEPSTLSAAFAVMTPAPVRPSPRHSAVADARPVRMSSAKPAAPISTAAQVAPVAPAVARFPELER
jgi:hypothetical protein